MYWSSAQVVFENRSDGLLGSVNRVKNAFNPKLEARWEM